MTAVAVGPVVIDADFAAFPPMGVHRVQEAKWDDIWGAPIVALSPHRRWLRERLALLGARVDLGNRFADPRHEFRETYGATCLVGALLEIWADDVPNEATVVAGRRVRRTAWDPAREVGVLPPARVDGRVVIRLVVSPALFVDVSTVRTRTWLVRRPQLRGPLMRAGAPGPRIDSGLLEGSGPRSRIVTQAVARFIFNDVRRPIGIAYRTRLGGSHQNWAIFARQPVGLVDRQPLRRADPAVVQALSELGLRL